MNWKSTVMLTVALVATFVSATSYGKDGGWVNICGRTPEVAEAIWAAFHGNPYHGGRHANGESTLWDKGENCRIPARNYVGDRVELGQIEGLFVQIRQSSTLKGGDFDRLPNVRGLTIHGPLESLSVPVFIGLTKLEYFSLNSTRLTELPLHIFDFGFAGRQPDKLRTLKIRQNPYLTSLRPNAFFPLRDQIHDLDLSYNNLTHLPEGIFDDLGSLQRLHLNHNALTTLPAAVFNESKSLQEISLEGNLLTELPAAVFSGLSNLKKLSIGDNRLSLLPDLLFDGLPNLRELALHENRIAALSVNTFNGLRNLTRLELADNELVVLHEKLFADLAHLTHLGLGRNSLQSLSSRLFDDVDALRTLHLQGNSLITLPVDIFHGLSALEYLTLDSNYLHLEDDDPLFRTLPHGALLVDAGQRFPARHFGIVVPLLVSSSSSTVGQGFVRIINKSRFNSVVDVRAFDSDGRAVGEVIEFVLDPWQAIHFNADDLEAGNPRKGIERGAGPMRGDWRLAIQIRRPDVKVESRRCHRYQFCYGERYNYVGAIQVLSYVRTSDGFLAPMHDVMQREKAWNTGGTHGSSSVYAPTFNPASNVKRVSKLRLVERHGADASVAIYAYDDEINTPAGPVNIDLAAGASRALSAVDLEVGAVGAVGALGDGAGKWFLDVRQDSRFGTDHRSVVGMSLLQSSSGHLSNLSTRGNTGNGNQLGTNEHYGIVEEDYGFEAADVPLLISSLDPMQQGFVRIRRLGFYGSQPFVKVVAIDDAGSVARPIEIPLLSHETIHFTAADLENGNPGKGIEEGIGRPTRGDWRLVLLSDGSGIEAMAYVRAEDGFLTAMHDVLWAENDGFRYFDDGQDQEFRDFWCGRSATPKTGELQQCSFRSTVAWTFNPASNDEQVSKLRLSNIGREEEPVLIQGIDDQGKGARPVSLTLLPGESRMLSAVDLEEGVSGLEGTLGDGVGKWRLFVVANFEHVRAMNLLYGRTGYISNLSTPGFAVGNGSSPIHAPHGRDDHHHSRRAATRVSLPSATQGTIDSLRDMDCFRFVVSARGAVVIEASGVNSLVTLFDARGNAIISTGVNKQYERLEVPLDEGTYYVRVESNWREPEIGRYTLHLVEGVDGRTKHIISSAHGRGNEHGDTLSSATGILLPSTTEGAIDPRDEADLFRFVVSATSTVVMETSGDLDTIGTLFDARGNHMGQDDDGAGHPNFRIERMLDEGTYYVRVQSAGAGTGGYTLHLWEDPSVYQ